MTISIDAEKSFDKVQHKAFMRKMLNKMDVEGADILMQIYIFNIH